jgi:uncharacterized protein YjiS (DUF1127 family)
MLYSPPSTRPFQALRKIAQTSTQITISWLASIGRKRAQREALRSLLRFNTALLDDIGIDRLDIVEALDAPDWAGYAFDLVRGRKERARR